MKVLYSIPVVLVVVIISSLLTFSSTGYERAYGQQEQTQNDPVNIKQEIETNLTLGKPLYTEKFTVPKTANDSLTNSEFSFSGEGILNGMKVTATGNGHALPRQDGTISVTSGRALFTSENGIASYSFEEILKKENNVERHLGAAFFDSSATGKLEFLKSIVAVYKSVIDKDGIGKFAMWQFDK